MVKKALTSSEEVEFIFQQFLEGLSDSDVAKKTSSNRNVTAKSATEIKELRQHFEAARKVLQAASITAARETTDRLLKYGID